MLVAQTRRFNDILLTKVENIHFGQEHWTIFGLKHQFEHKLLCIACLAAVCVSITLHIQSY